MKMRTLLVGCALIAAGTLSAVNIEWTFDEAAAVRLPASTQDRASTWTFDWSAWAWEDSGLLPPVGFMLLFR